VATISIIFVRINWAKRRTKMKKSVLS